MTVLRARSANFVWESADIEELRCILNWNSHTVDLVCQLQPGSNKKVQKLSPLPQNTFFVWVKFAKRFLWSQAGEFLLKALWVAISAPSEQYRVCVRNLQRSLAPLPVCLTSSMFLTEKLLADFYQTEKHVFVWKLSFSGTTVVFLLQLSQHTDRMVNFNLKCTLTLRYRPILIRS